MSRGTPGPAGNRNGPFRRTMKGPDKASSSSQTSSKRPNKVVTTRGRRRERRSKASTTSADPFGISPSSQALNNSPRLWLRLSPLYAETPRSWNVRDSFRMRLFSSQYFRVPSAAAQATRHRLASWKKSGYANMLPARRADAPVVLFSISWELECLKKVW